MISDFDKMFDDFLDRREYDAAENALFSMVRISFLGGWLAAGGNPPKPQKILWLTNQDNPSKHQKIIKFKRKNIPNLSSGIDTDLKPK